MWRQQILEELDFGKSVAEQDENLNQYYVDTNVYQEIIADRIDIVRGQKGSGKSAILKRLLAKKEPGIRIKTADNLTGDSVFRQVFSTAFFDYKELPSEQILADAWKIYFLNVAIDEFNLFLKSSSLPKRIYYYLIYTLPLRKKLKFYRIFNNAKDLGSKLRFAIRRLGIVIQDSTGTTYDSYIEVESGGFKGTGIPFNDLYRDFNNYLRKLGVSIWVCLDKLDEAFQNLDENIEYCALRSLLTAYKDVMIYSNLKIKIFIRDDIFNRVTYEGFIALTHIRPKTSLPIVWDSDKLLHLLVERIVFPKRVCALLKEIGFEKTPSNSNERMQLLRRILPSQIDAGKESDTFTWIVNRVQDGTGVSTPRDVIDLLINAKGNQVERWRINPPTEDTTIILEPSAFKTGLKQLSRDKLSTHLYAEYPSLKTIIEKFRNLKTEYDEVSLRHLLGNDFNLLNDLVNIGFFKKRKEANTWWVPFIYRDGLEMTQGKYIQGKDHPSSDTEVAATSLPSR